VAKGDTEKYILARLDQIENSLGKLNIGRGGPWPTRPDVGVNLRLELAGDLEEEYLKELSYDLARLTVCREIQWGLKDGDGRIIEMVGCRATDSVKLRKVVEKHGAVLKSMSARRGSNEPLPSSFRPSTSE
jgi:hypothetical protein